MKPYITMEEVIANQGEGRKGYTFLSEAIRHIIELSIQKERKSLFY